MWQVSFISSVLLPRHKIYLFAEQTQSCPHQCQEITYCLEPNRIPKEMESDQIAQECGKLNMTKNEGFSPSNLSQFHISR